MATPELFAKFPEMKPIKGPPTLHRVNGCGMAVIGKRDYDQETRTYIKTWCLFFVFIPVLCFRAYRVSDAARGWYFLGREPISPLARGFNVAVLSSILLLVGYVQWDKFQKSPEYKAKQQMKAAAESAHGSKLADAARTYVQVIMGNTSQSSIANRELGQIVDTQCPQAPLSEAIGVYSALIQLNRHTGEPATTEIAAKATKLVGTNGDKSPRQGVALLDLVRPLVLDTRSLDADRLTLLQKWVAAEPTNLAAVVPLASILEEQNQLPEAKKMLTPVAGQLGDGEGARVLGTILAREGDLDGSYGLLWPYVKTRLDELHRSEKSFDRIEQQIWDSQLEQLRQNHAPDSFYTSYKAAGEGEKKALVSNYINGRMKVDPRFQDAQKQLAQSAHVVPVALDLGIVMLQRAQGEKNADARKGQLESAEKVFLSVGGVAGETSTYRLSLGQVYYWLGKQAEGHKLFDAYLTSNGRSADALMQVAHRVREVGATPEARSLAEDAYGKYTDEDKKFSAAHFRSTIMKDLDDQIAWLRKSDTNDAKVEASLAQAQGEKAYSEGRDQEAANFYQDALAAYEKQPRNAAKLNNQALLYGSMFYSTGDPADLDRCIDHFQQAIDLVPTNSVVLNNAAQALLSVALTDVIGKQIDLRALHETGTLSLIAHLYNDQTTRQTLVQRIREHPGVKRSLSYLEKVMVLAPKSAIAYGEAFSIYEFTRDEAALKALLDRLTAAGVDTTDTVASAREYYSGQGDQKGLAQLEASAKRTADLAQQLRPRGGPTAAFAIDNQIALQLIKAARGQTVDCDQLVKLALEADHLAPSSTTGRQLSAAYLQRAVQNLSQSDPAFAAFAKRYQRALGAAHLIAWAISEPSTYRAAVQKDADVLRVIDLLKGELLRYPESSSGIDWAMYKGIGSQEVQKLENNLKDKPRKMVENAIADILSPASADHVLESYWLLQMLGKSDEARAVLNKATALGVPVPAPD